MFPEIVTPSGTYTPGSTGAVLARHYMNRDLIVNFFWGPHGFHKLSRFGIMLFRSLLFILCSPKGSLLLGPAWLQDQL